MRPPYGQVGGSALLAAAEMGYDVAMWSDYADHPPGLVDYIVDAAAAASPW